MSRIVSRWRKKDKDKVEPSILPPSPLSSSKSSLSSPPTLSSSVASASALASPYVSTRSGSYQRSHINVPGHIRPVTCTNFLMGGQYYPGKDKKRNMLRRRTLWYRLFCSTKKRLVGSFVICSYLVVVFALMPLLDMIDDYGHYLSRGGVERKGRVRGTGPRPFPMLSDAVRMEQIQSDGKAENKGADADDHDFEEEHDEHIPEHEKEHDEPDSNNIKVTIDHNFEGAHDEPDSNSIHNMDLDKKEGETSKHDNIHGIPENPSKTAENEQISPLHNIDPAPEATIIIKSPEIMKQDAQLVNKKLDEYRNQTDRINERNDILRQMAPRLYDAAFPDEKYDGDNETKEDIIDIHIPNKNSGARNSSHVQEHYDEHEKKQQIHEHVSNTTITKTTATTTSANMSSNGNDSTSIEIIRTLQNRVSHHRFSKCPKDGVQSVAITLVIQTTFDRLDLIQLICQRWKAQPIVISVYLDQNEFDDHWNDVKSKHKQLCGYHGDGDDNNRRIIFVPYLSKSADERDLEYPINKLRNLALDQVTTSHVLLIDVDLIPSQNLDQSILDSLALAKERRADDDGDRGVDPLDAIVVPTFERRILGDSNCETIEECHEYIKDVTFIPSNLSELKEQIVMEQCIVFQSDMNKYGHFDTNTEAWLKSSYDEKSSQILRQIQCFQSLRYEPFVVIPWCAMEVNEKKIFMRRPGPRSPYYDERFMGYGKNKIQQVAHLRRKGFVFLVMPPTGFLTHFPHPISETKKIWNDKEMYDLHSKMDSLYPKYLQELNDAYEDIQSQTKVCQSKRGNKKTNRLI